MKNYLLVSSIYKKRIRKDGVILSDIKSQIENTCSEDEISNNNLKYQKIISQILDHKKKLFDLEKEIALLRESMKFNLVCINT